MGRKPRRPDAFGMAVLDELRAEAAAKGVADSNLAELSGFNKSVMSRMKSGEKVVDLDQLESMCLTLNIAPHVIVERAERRGGGKIVQFPNAPIPPMDDVEHERAALGHDVEAELEAGQIEP